MTEAAPHPCVHLGLLEDPTVMRSQADIRHYCYARTPPAALGLGYQERYCLAGQFAACKFYAPPELHTHSAGQPIAEPGSRRALLLPGLAAAILILVAALFARNLLSARPTFPPPDTVAATLTDAPARAVTGPTPAVPAALASAARVSPEPPVATPTPEPGGRVLTLKAEPGRTGWWSSEDDRGKYLGDSFLYSGFTDGRSFLAIATIDLRKVPHGAPLRLALLQLTGLSAARLRPEAGGQWQVQLLAADAVPDLTGASFQTLSGIPAAITLLPALSAADLDAGQSNVWQFGQAEREWLAAQLDAGAASVVARVSGPTAGKNTLFAWDSGSGPATKGEGPRLVLSLGPAPYATAAPTTRQTGTAVGTATQIATPRH